jgi:hypothetical protein
VPEPIVDVEEGADDPVRKSTVQQFRGIQGNIPPDRQLSQDRVCCSQTVIVLVHLGASDFYGGTPDFTDQMDPAMDTTTSRMPPP